MKLIAHRGNNNHDYIENSKEALLDSLSKPYINGIEFDIRLTKDKKIIIIHDKTIGEDNTNICDLTLEEIKKHSTSKNKIATLDELLQDVKSNKLLLIEIKEEKNSFEICEVLNNILRKYKYLNIYICSFNYSLITYFKNNFHYPTGLIIGKLANLNKDIEIFNFVSIYYGHFKKYKTVKKLFIWTVNKKNIIKKYPDNCFIITDKANILK